MNRIDRFCEAIMAYEGWKPGSHSYRTNNPGNLRCSPMALNTVDGYAVFDSFSTGWNALLRDITLKASGESRTTIRPTSSIREFFSVYAPSEDDNDPEKYAAYVIDRAKLPPDCTLGDLLKKE